MPQQGGGSRSPRPRGFSDSYDFQSPPHLRPSPPFPTRSFSDSYDYQDIRRHYLHNEVTNVDMGFRFYVHVAPDAYARPLEDARAFAAVSRDVAQVRRS